MLKVPDAKNDASGSKYFTCALCGGSYTQVEIPFSSGSVVPTDGETLTGATSGATAVVDNVKLISGAWDGTATGIIWATSPTGIDFDTGHWGTEDEAVTGETTARFNIDGYGHKKSYGRYYSEDDIVERDGVFLCGAHNSARWNFRDLNESVIDIDKGDRE
jgi:hypothetical protein